MPKKDCAVRVTCPVPLHSVQEIFLVPSFAPVPPHVSQEICFFVRIRFVVPVYASRSVMRIPTSASRPCVSRGPLLLPPRPPPKKVSKISPISPKPCPPKGFPEPPWNCGPSSEPNWS